MIFFIFDTSAGDFRKKITGTQIGKTFISIYHNAIILSESGRCYNSIELSAPSYAKKIQFSLSAIISVLSVSGAALPDSEPFDLS